MVRAMADHVTACVDAVAVDIDPTGLGWARWGPAPPAGLTPGDAEALLEELLAMAEARIAALGATPTTGRRAWTVWRSWRSWTSPRLTAAGKRRALDLLRIGGKAR